jgi:hypothetical protein
MRGAITLLPLYAFIAWTGTALSLSLFHNYRKGFLILNCANIAAYVLWAQGTGNVVKERDSWCRHSSNGRAG